MQKITNTSEKGNFKEGFTFKSLSQTMALLDCSKFYLYKLIRKGIIKPYYIERDDSGKETGKPYFNSKEIESNFFQSTK